MNKYLTVRTIDNGFILPIPLCCGIVNGSGDLIIPEKQRVIR